VANFFDGGPKKSRINCPARSALFVL